MGCWLVKVFVIFLLVSLLFAGAATVVHAESYSSILKWGSLGAGDGQFNQPEGVAVDGAGNVYVVDFRNHRVQKFTEFWRISAKVG